MKYKFPTIRTIQDVLPHVKHRKEFIVAERDGFTVVNYNVVLPDSFDMEKDQVGGAIRRECRGLIFGPSGKIMSRPFHKFFNVGERNETRVENVDIRQNHLITEKLDGSMIRPIIVNNEVRLATKMGITDVSIQAEEWLFNHSKKELFKTWMRAMIILGETPIFEWVSPDNRIVVKYEKEDLVLLAIRNTVFGDYASREHLKLNPGFTIVEQYGKVGNLNEYISHLRLNENSEGIVLHFVDGHKVKAKNDWYVNLHKIMSKFQFDRHIIEAILEERLDDVYGMLPIEEQDRIGNLENGFWKAVAEKTDHLEKLYILAKTKYDGNNKRVALELIPTLDNKLDGQFLFKLLNGYDITDLVIDYVHKNLNTNVKWEACKKWLKM